MIYLQRLTYLKVYQKQGSCNVKHANPCGVSVKSNKIESYKSALKCDPISAFGGE